MNVSVSNIGIHSVEVDWTPGRSESEWQVVIGPAGFNPETAGAGVVVTAYNHPVTLTNLADASFYDVYVRAACENQTYSDWSSAISFRTQCFPINSLPYNESFDSLGSANYTFPLCWEKNSTSLFATNIWYLGSTQFTLGGSIPVESAASSFLLPAFVLSFCGFSVKAAMAPFSGWLIKAAVAPTPVTALLHAVAVVNAGAFACIRLTYYVYGTDILHGTWAQYLVMLMTAVTIVYGSSFAVKEKHFKRRLAYSTISNLSYILFAATIMTPMGLTAAFAHMIMHSLTKICSFFCCGIVMEQTGKEYIDELSGLGRVMKKTFVCFTISSLSLIGIPLFCGFFSKWRIGLAAVDEGSPFAITGLLAVLFSALLTAIYMLGIVIKAYFPLATDKEKTAASVQGIKEHSWQMLLPVICFAAGILIFGVFWQPLLDFITF